MPGIAFTCGERVTLRTIERDDVAFLQRGRNHPVVRSPLGLPDPTNAKQVEENIGDWVETDDSANLLVCLDSDGGEGPDRADSDDAESTPIGVVNVWNLDDLRPNLAYWLLPDYHGEGYATEAVTLILDHLFENYDARGVEAGVFEHNDASQALLERLGFVREGKLRESAFAEGAYRDKYVYGLLRDEWVGDESVSER